MSATTATAPAKVKRVQRPQNAPRTIYMVFEMLNDQGEVVPFDKRKLRLLSVERDSEIVMEMTDPVSGNHPQAFYVRGKTPAPKSRPRLATAEQATQQAAVSQQAGRARATAA